MSEAAAVRHYTRFAGIVHDKLRGAIAPGDLTALHEVSAPRHFAIALRHIALYCLCAWALARFPSPWIWLPLGILQGSQILGFIILLHEVVHGSIFARPRPLIERFLGCLYALPAAISATQFTRWHLDHHAELGSNTADPKRAYLTPKIVTRLFKLLYFTPALFFIYARASARAAAAYPPAMQRTIRIEKSAAMLIHIAVMIALYRLDPGVLWRAYLFPLFFAFPPAFVINRLGQHYDIDPSRPEAWSTRIDGGPITRFLFLASNHHIEHHYYPAVPFYRLCALNRALRPFFAAQKIENRSYLRLLAGWLLRNETPHTAWRRPPGADGAEAAQIQ